MTLDGNGGAPPIPKKLEFFRDALGSAAAFGGDSEEDDIRVEDVEIAGSNRLGENFGSAMTFANVKFRTRKGPKNVGVVIKCLQETEWHVEVMNIYALFDKEVEFYRKTMPAIAKFQTERGMAQTSCIGELVPKCMFAKAHGDEHIVITENLREKGYCMADRHRGLGLRHSIVALRTLGRFHAASLAMKILEPGAFWEASRNSIREVNFIKGREKLFERFYNQLAVGKIEALILSEVEKGVDDADLLLRVASVADRVIKERFQLSQDILQRYREPLAVINHGDFWVNNIMYRYDKNVRKEEVPVAAKLLDFQMTRYGSPSLDLHTFLYTSTTYALRKDHGEDLLRAYHDALLAGIREAGVDLESLSPCESNGMNNAENLGKVGGRGQEVGHIDLPDSHPLSFKALKEDVQRHWPWGLMLAELMLRIVLGDPSEAASSIEDTIITTKSTNGHTNKDETLAGCEMMKKLTTKACDQRYLEVIREFAHKGYFDNQNIYYYPS
ncbi:uncharacterized protein LOC124153423 isoform X2 [Ischnura elegans]|nr:uncharacterized protein LOC124153423 isoform X2 [Ischnura elegans]